MLRLWTAFQSRIVLEEKGATAVEYGLLVALIAAVIIAAVVLLGGAINGAFGSINSKMPAGS